MSGNFVGAIFFAETMEGVLRGLIVITFQRENDPGRAQAVGLLLPVTPISREGLLAILTKSVTGYGLAR